VEEARTFRAGVLGDRECVKGFRVVASDGRVGRVSWASYAPGESYLVLTNGWVLRRHRVVPAGVVTHITDGEVHVALSCSEIAGLPLLPHPEAPVGDEHVEQMLNAVERAAAYTIRT